MPSVGWEAEATGGPEESEVYLVVRARTGGVWAGIRLAVSNVCMYVCMYTYFGCRTEGGEKGEGGGRKLLAGRQGRGDRGAGCE